MPVVAIALDANGVQAPPVDTSSDAGARFYLSMMTAGLIACLYHVGKEQDILGCMQLCVMFVAFLAMAYSELSSAPCTPQWNIPWVFWTLVNIVVMIMFVHQVRVSNDASLCRVRYPRDFLFRNGLISIKCAKNGDFSVIASHIDLEYAQLNSLNLGKDWSNKSEEEICHHVATKFWWNDTDHDPQFTQDVLPKIQKHSDARKILFINESTELPYSHVSCSNVKRVLLQTLKMDKSTLWIRVCAMKAVLYFKVYIYGELMKIIFSTKSSSGTWNKFFSLLMGGSILTAMGTLGSDALNFVWGLCQAPSWNFGDYKIVEQVKIFFTIVVPLLKIEAVRGVLLPPIQVGFFIVAIALSDWGLNTLAAWKIGTSSPLNDAFVAETMSLVQSLFFVFLLVNMFGKSWKTRTTGVFWAFFVALNGFFSTLQPFNVLAVAGFEDLFPMISSKVSEQAKIEDGAENRNNSTQHGATQSRASAKKAKPPSGGGGGRAHVALRPATPASPAPPGPQSQTQASGPVQAPGTITWGEVIANGAQKTFNRFTASWTTGQDGRAAEGSKKRNREAAGLDVQREPWWTKLRRGLRGGTKSAREKVISGLRGACAAFVKITGNEKMLKKRKKKMDRNTAEGGQQQVENNQAGTNEVAQKKRKQKA